MNVLSIVLRKFCEKNFCGALFAKKAADKGSAAGEYMFFRCAGFPQPAVCISAARICLRANAKAARRRAEKGKSRFRLSGEALSARKKAGAGKAARSRIFLFCANKKRRTKGPPQGEYMFFRCAGFPQLAVCISAARLCFGAECKGSPAASRKRQTQILT